jgi:hypothetical protein
VDAGTREILIQRYLENGQATRAFWEWRYKILSLSSVVLAGLGALATWSYQHNLGPVVVLPFVLSTIFCGVFAALTYRTTGIVNECYAVASAIEERWDADDPGPKVPGTYARIQATGKEARWTAHGKTLLRVYILLAALSAGGAVVFGFSAPS